MEIPAYEIVAVGSAVIVIEVVAVLLHAPTSEMNM